MATRGSDVGGFSKNWPTFELSMTSLKKKKKSSAEIHFFRNQCAGVLSSASHCHVVFAEWKSQSSGRAADWIAMPVNLLIS